jgi:hypothetical protein
MGDFYSLCVFYINFRRSEEFFTKFHELLTSIHTVSGISVGVSVPADASTLAGVSTCAVASSCCYGSFFAVDVCDVPIVSPAVHPTCSLIVVF